MTILLTSSPTGDLDGRYRCSGFDSRNGFADQLKKLWRNNARVLMITAFPDNASANDEMKRFFHDAVLKSGLDCGQFDLWDGHILSDKMQYSREKLQSYDVIILGGGHVPTQQRFFEQLQLRDHIKDFDGIVIGISAGTMNCAELVYAQPEEAGEAIDPEYQRFIPGLGITKMNILPHYQLTKNAVVDGLRVFEDITFADSMGREFLALPDGSYVIDRNGEIEICGEAYQIKDGKIRRV